ncbi:unnamed protein product, partial [marine sediment metagenome]
YQNRKNSTDQEDTSWWEEGKAGVNIYFPFKGQTATSANSRPYWQTFSIGYQYEKLSSITTTTPQPLDADPVNIASLRLGYYYSDAEKYGFSISPEQGYSFSLTYEHADKVLGGDYTFDKLIFDGRKFIPLPFLHQVLSLRLVAGFSSPNIIDQNLDWEKFKLGGHYSADNLSNVDVETFSLRGYKPALLEGNNLLLTSLEYRFPIANIEHSVNLGPISFFLERLSGALFVDIGNAWENKVNDINWKDFKIGMGGEIKADLNWQLDSPFTLRLGAAKALTSPY